MPSEARRVGAEMRQFIGEKITDFTLHLTDELAVATPVDTGFARASWRPTSGSPGPETPENPGRSGGDPQAAAATQAAKQQAARAAFGAVPRINDKFITNNADYINELNAGKSPQAPAGFVQGVIDDNTD